MSTWGIHSTYINIYQYICTTGNHFRGVIIIFTAVMYSHYFVMTSIHNKPLARVVGWHQGHCEFLSFGWFCRMLTLQNDGKQWYSVNS